MISLSHKFLDPKLPIYFIPLRSTYEGRFKFRGLTLLLRVGTLWRCGDGLSFEVPPLTSDALLTTLHSLLENVLQTVCHKLQGEPRSSLFMVGKAQKSHGGEIWTVWRKRIGKWIGGTPLEHPPYSPNLGP
jgi:hypothetical protein